MTTPRQVSISLQGCNKIASPRVRLQSRGQQRSQRFKRGLSWVLFSHHLSFLQPNTQTSMAPQPTGAASATGSTTGSATALATTATATTATVPPPPPPDSVDATAVQNEQTRQALELKLQELIECLLELSITVYDFQTESNLLVHQKM